MRSKSIERRTIESIVANGFLFVINFLQNIVLVPLLLQNWGTEKYGIWISLYAVFTILQSIDIGHQNYVGNEFNKYYHIDKAKAKTILGSSIYAASAIGLIVFLLTFVGTISGLADKWIAGSSHTSQSNIGWSLVILSAMWILAGSVGGILVRIILPLGLMAKFTYLSIILRLSMFLVLLIGAWLQWSLFKVSIFYSLVQLMYSWGIFLYIRKLMPDFFPWWKGASIKTAWKNFRRSLVLTINNFLDQLGNNGLVLLISNSLSAFAVPLFTTMRTVANTALLGTNTFIQSIYPDIIRLHVTKEKTRLREVFYTNWLVTGMPINLLFIILPNGNQASHQLR